MADTLHGADVLQLRRMAVPIATPACLLSVTDRIGNEPANDVDDQ